MSHVYAYPSGGQVEAFGKGGMLHLPFRETGQHIAVFTLQQMCHLFYLKGASILALDCVLKFSVFSELTVQEAEEHLVE